jgi:uncharacterized protein (DUF58 family)
MLSPEIIARIKSLSLRGRHLASDIMAGDYASAFHGRGMEFHEVREYVPGDDVRGIDWNVTARMNVPFVKVFREERELTLMLMVDVSASMGLGKSRSRIAAAAELAAILAWLAIKSNDRVGLLLFGEKIELYVPPRKGPSHVWRIIKELLTWSYRSPGTNISSAGEHIAKVLKRRSVCFLISDFLTEDSLLALSRLAGLHDLTCVLMDHEPLDGALMAGGTGVVLYRDVETKEIIEVDTSNRQVMTELEDCHRQWLLTTESAVRRSGADFLRVQTDKSVVDPLMEYLKRHRSNRPRRAL